MEYACSNKPTFCYLYPTIHVFCYTLRCQINAPLLINFSIFSNPLNFIMTPCLLILRKLTSFTNHSFHFLSLLILFMPKFHGKIAQCCIYFSFMLYDNLHLFVLSLYNNLKPFLKVRPPRLSTFGTFPTPLFIWTPIYWHLRVRVWFIRK